ncbi:hypothetical protein HanRHA438_Chr07g0293751 [Helianthus annuus]|nr:hypothetical protein HanRHA438_Chr07g0293751 [Helianthus annuus]
MKKKVNDLHICKLVMRTSYLVLVAFICYCYMYVHKLHLCKHICLYMCTSLTKNMHIGLGFSIVVYIYVTLCYVVTK